MRILFVGDIVGRSGRSILLGRLPAWLRLARRIPGGPRLVNAVTGFAPTRRIGALVGGLAGERRIPPLAKVSFVDGFRARKASAGPASASVPRPRVVLWPDTFTNHLAPGVGAARPGSSEARRFFMTKRASRLRGRADRPAADFQAAVQPPSIGRLAPVMDFAASEQR